ncbi:MAG: acyl-CoA dehydrogenase family protein [Thermoplasmata archaeon]|nr:acyl-CoA dehydrogenase family protein [Thermoplasmata archaeon]
MTDGSGGWRTKAREFAQSTIIPRAEAMDRSDEMPAEIREGLAAGGFMGLGLPTQWGGHPATAADLVGVLEELAVGSAAVATLLAVHLSVAASPIAAWGTVGQQQQFLPSLARGRFLGAFGLTEPEAGSDAASLRTRYTRSDAGFALNGSKMFITNAASADVIVTFATRDPSLGRDGISAFLLPKGTPGFSIAQRLDKLGLRGSETTEMVLANAALGPDAMLGPEGQGLKVALSSLAGGRIGIAACALGVARAGFDEMQRQARSEPADWKRTEVARAFTDLAAARALVERAAADRDAGRPYAESASTAKLFASMAAMRIAHRGFEVAGRTAARAGAPSERILRDARVFPIVEGTTEIQELILGRRLVSGDGAR